MQKVSYGLKFIDTVKFGLWCPPLVAVLLQGIENMEEIFWCCIVGRPMNNSICADGTDPLATLFRTVPQISGLCKQKTDKQKNLSSAETFSDFRILF